VSPGKNVQHPAARTAGFSPVLERASRKPQQIGLFFRMALALLGKAA
jgi:hypothetical protein